MRDAVLGALVATLIGVIGFLFLTKDNNNAGAYNPYNVAGASMPGQAVPAQAPGQPASAQAAPEPIKTIVIKQTIAPGQPKKPSKPDAPTVPAPRILQTQNLAELMTLINMFGPCTVTGEKGGGFTLSATGGGTLMTLNGERVTKVKMGGDGFMEVFIDGQSLYGYHGLKAGKVGDCFSGNSEGTEVAVCRS